MWSRLISLLKRNPIPFLIILWLVGWVLIGVFGKTNILSIQLPQRTPAAETTKPSTQRPPEHRMSEVARRNAVTPLVNESRFARLERRVDGLESRVSALEEWRKGKGKRAALTPPPPPFKPKRPATPKPPPPKEKGVFGFEKVEWNRDWTPNWERLEGQQ